MITPSSSVLRRGRVRAASLVLGGVLATVLARADVLPVRYPDTPQMQFQDLFVAVQMAAVLGDGKVFPDTLPKAPPAEILAQYHAAGAAALSPEALKRFVEEHFSLPVAPAVEARPESVSITAHIDALWDVLTRRTPDAPRFSSLLPLPEPYVVPGGRFREIYYWDSYFTMLGLEESGRNDLVAAMIADFAHLIDTYGHIPNGTRSYYLSRSQPPFFFAMVALLSPGDPAAAFARYLPELEREHAFWMDGAQGLKAGAAHRRVVALPDGSILNRYWDDRDTPRDESFREDTELARSGRGDAAPKYRNIRAAAESGWDFSSRWFSDGKTRATIDTTDVVPVDLNSLMYGLELAIRDGCRRHVEPGCVKQFEGLAAARRKAVDRYLWSESRGAYVDYRWPTRARGTQLTAATLYPLFVALASKSQARAVAGSVAHGLVQPGGIVTTTLETGEQWDSPNGWAPLQWIAVDGLRRYGETVLARGIACRWMTNVNAVYRQTGKLVEKYDVVHTGRPGGGGEYPTQDGFGWTNGVMRKLMTLYPAEAADTAPAPCASLERLPRAS
jgi:alpha,alpha-trehalase